MTIIPGSVHVFRVLSGKAGLTLNENRYLTEWPKPSEVDGPVAYTQGVEAYINDNFGLRAEAVKFYSRVYAKFGTSGPVVKGNSPGWFFLQDAWVWRSYQGNATFTDTTINRWLEALSELKIESEKSGAVFAAIIPPNKVRIYPEVAPARYGQPSPRRFVNFLYQHPQANDLGLRNIEPMLLQVKAQHPVYYKTDTHWTSTGAYEGYFAVMNVFNEKGNRFPILEKQALVEVSKKDYSGDLAKLMGQKDVITEAISMQSAPSTPQKFVKTVLNKTPEMSGWRVTIHTNQGQANHVQDGTTLVIIGDSFSNAPLSYFKHSFDTVVHMQRIEVFNTKFALNNLRIYKPDAVLFVAVERNAEQWIGEP